MEKVSRFFAHTVTKSILLTLLPVIYSVLATFTFSRDSNDMIIWNRKILSFCIVLFIIHIVLLVVYGRQEEKQKKTIYQLSQDVFRKEALNLPPLLQSFEKLIFDNSDKLYQTLHRKRGHFDIHDWAWIQERGDALCMAIYSFIDKIAEKGSGFAVSIIFKKVEDSARGYTMSSRYAPHNPPRPKIYRAFIREEQAEGKFYKSLLDKGFTEPVILADEQAVKANFKDNADDYSQFIALPISCTGGNTIGILQIAVYKGNLISPKIEELKRLCNTYFDLGSTAMLLTDKVENVHQML